MSTDEASKKTSRPALVVLDRGFKLAEKWVNDMGWPSEDERSTGADLEARPPRLGIGATVPRQFKAVHANNPIERKLRMKLDADKKKSAKSSEEPASTIKGEAVGEESDEDIESKAQAFSKRRAVNFASSPPGRKKQK